MLLTGIVTDKIYGHLGQQNSLEEEQNYIEKIQKVPKTYYILIEQLIENLSSGKRL